MRRMRPILALTSLGLVGCSVITDADKVACRAQADCGAGFACSAEGFCTTLVGDGDFGCIEDGPAEPPESGPVSIALPIVDLTRTEPVTDATVWLCASIDPECTAPVAGPVTTDSEGLARFEVDAQFQGVAAIERDLYPRTLAVVDVTRPPTLLESFGLVTSQSFESFGSLLTSEPTTSLIALTAFDCRGEPGVGVTFEIAGDTGQALPYYLQGAFPSSTATRTDNVGVGGYVNLPAGSFEITATLSATGQELGRVVVPVLEGHLVNAIFHPQALSRQAP